MEKLVTVVMPVYNGERFLINSIGDIRRQTYSSWELICVDDGSTDLSSEILKQQMQEDGRIKILHQKNRGAANARNRAMEYISGEYVLFLDADDRFMPNLLEKAMQSAADLETDVLIFDAECFDNETGKKLRSEWLVKRDKVPGGKVFRFQDFPEDVLIFSHSVPWNKLYRADFLRENNLSFQEIPCEEDVLFVNMAYIKAKRMAFLDEALVRYRQNNIGSLSGACTRQEYPLCVYEAMEALRQWLLKEGIYGLVRKGFVNYAAEHFLWNLEVIDGGSYDCLFAKTKEYFTEVIHIGELSLEDFMRKDLYCKAKCLCQSGGREYLFFLLQEKLKAVEKINRDFAGLLEYSEKLKRMLDLAGEQKKWFFKNKKIAKGSRIILYGAGEVGRDYCEQFKREGQYDLIAWIDKYHNGITESGFMIEAPEVISTYKYDYVIIAVSESYVAGEIRRELNCLGVLDCRMVDMFRR